MSYKVHPQMVIGLLISAAVLCTQAARAATPTVDQALRLAPIQEGVDYSHPTPEEVSKCKINPRKIDGMVGWIVEDPNGLILRRFVDTNGDNVVDQWSYYKDGVEVYRDIDSDFNGKADQSRWFHTGGTRWGLDKSEDGKIDAWKVISPEEATAEVAAALATRNVEQFARVALTPEEAKSLGLGKEKTAALTEKVAGLTTAFKQVAARQKGLTPESKWLQFSATRPGIVPAGTDGSSKDLRVYENVVAIVETAGKHGQLQIGTLVQVGEVWRVIDVPQPVEGQAELASNGFFFQATMANRGEGAAGSGNNEEVQKLLAELEKYDKETAAQASTPEQLAARTSHRAELLEKIADTVRTPQDRALWIRQLIDMIGAAVQSGTYPDGPKRLEGLFEKLQKKEADKELAPHAKFVQLAAEYAQSLQAPKADFAKIQTQWLKNLEQFVGDYPGAPDAAEAMLQLGIAQEFAGQEDDAKKWFTRIVKESPKSAAAVKAAGAAARLDSVGKPISLSGRGISGSVVDLTKYRGKVVLIQYWATWCKPAKEDMATLKDLFAKYGKSFTIIGVSLDSSAKELSDFLAQNRLPWPQIYEDGGLDSRPANQLGILTVPTMILVDQNGKVVNRSIQTAELEGELKKLLR